jgi:hypothetical protein
MEYPNIQVITIDQNIYLYKNQFKRTTKNDFLKEDCILTPDTAIIVISQIIDNVGPVIEYLKIKKINFLYIFIDDVFRCSLGIVNEEYSELTQIEKIIEYSSIKNFKIYHCEKLTNSFSEKYKFNHNIAYTDLFLYTWILNNNHPFELTYTFNKKITCLNNRNSPHRAIISSLLIKNKDALVTVNEKFSTFDIQNCKHIRIEHMKKDLKILKKLKFLEKNYQSYTDSKNISKEILSSKLQNSQSVYANIKNSFVNLVTETTFESEFPYVSEKTIKPILCCRPFIILGAPGTLTMLKSFGFKTFNEWWDESYDLELDPTKRLEKVHNIANDILNEDYRSLQKKLKKMTGVLLFNKNYLKCLPIILKSKI